MGYSLTPAGGAVGLVDYSLVPIWEIDLLYAVFALLALAHAVAKKERALWLSCLLGGLVCEQASIRGGGTHCHHSGLVDVSPCSSANSVLFYGPWVYSAVMGARRAGGRGALAQAAWTGLLTGLMCWPYEMQGPLSGFWKWAGPDGLLMPKSAMGSFWSVTNDPERGFSTHPLAHADLSVRAFGFPIHAACFDMAYGVGIGASFAVLPSMPALFHTLVLGPALAIADIRLPIALAELLGGSVFVLDPCLMALTIVAALSSPSGAAARGPDWLLVAGPLLCQAYWGAMVWRGLAPLPGDLKAIILSITVGGLWTWYQMGRSLGRAAGGREGGANGKALAKGGKSS